MKKSLSLLLCIAILLSCCSCSKINSLFSKNAEQSFSYPIGEMPKTLDPQIASTEAELIVIENCMEGLVRVNAEGEIVPAIAESWDISADGLRYTFHLNRNAAWSVDEDFELQNFSATITARDFVFAVSRAVLKETNAPDYQSVSLIKNAHKIHDSGKADTSSLGVKAKDDFTLEITLESPNSDFLTSLTASVFMPCSEQFFEYCAGRYGRQAKYFLSNAGFELRAWNETNIVMCKNENYLLPNTAKPDTVTLYRDENAFESFKNNNYDALAVSDDNIEEVLTDNTLRMQAYDDTVWVLGFHCGSELCASKQFRSALCMAVNRDRLQAHEWTLPATGPVPNICTAGGENYRQSIGGVILPKYAPEKAKQKYTSFYDSYLEENDVEELPTLRLLCTAAFEQTAKLIVQGWQMIFGTGLEVNITVLPLEQLEQAVKAGEYDSVILPVSADTTDALVFLKKFSAENVFSYSSQTFVRTINSGKSEKAKCLKAERLLIEDAFIYPLYTSNSYYVQRKNISGIYFYAFGGKVNFLSAERVKA